MATRNFVKKLMEISNTIYFIIKICKLTVWLLTFMLTLLVAVPVTVAVIAANTNIPYMAQINVIVRPMIVFGTTSPYLKQIQQQQKQKQQQLQHDKS